MGEGLEYSLINSIFTTPRDYIIDYGSLFIVESSKYINALSGININEINNSEINESNSETIPTITTTIIDNNFTVLQTINLHLDIYNNLIYYQFYTYLLFIIIIGYCSNILANYYLDKYNSKQLHNNNVTHILDTIKYNPNKITEGLFIDSLLEIKSNNKYINDKIKDNYNNVLMTTNSYYVLIRIKTNNDIQMKTSKYNLRHEKVTDGNKYNKNISDFYMIMKFSHTYNINHSVIMNDVIMNIMNIYNYLSPNEYKNKDFIIIAISKINNTNTNFNTNNDINNNNNEFYKSLTNTNYELCNIKTVNLNEKDKHNTYMLLLPLKEIYDLYMDVFNNVIFESIGYKIDNDNNEYWYNESLNTI